MRKPANFAKLLDRQIELQVEEANATQETERANGNDEFEGEKEHAIRKRNIGELHRCMNLAIEKRKYRLAHAAKTRDTDRQWDLVAAGTEEGVIEFFKLQGSEATKMRGRS